MDGRSPPISPNALCGPIDTDAVPTDSVRESSSIVYSGSAQRISEGFASALRAMGFEAGFLPTGVAQHDTTSNPKES
jgi:hypothetical protein